MHMCTESPCLDRRPPSPAAQTFAARRAMLAGLTAASRRRVAQLIRLAAALSPPSMPSRIPGALGRTEEVADALWRVIRTRDDSRDGSWIIASAERMIAAMVEHILSPLVPAEDALLHGVADPRPGNYYVSVIRGGVRGGDPVHGQDYRLVAGPWPTHTEAIRQVGAARVEAGKLYRLDPWDRWGTARVEDPTVPAILPPADYVARLAARDAEVTAAQNVSAPRTSRRSARR